MKASKINYCADRKHWLHISHGPPPTSIYLIHYLDAELLCAVWESGNLYNCAVEDMTERFHMGYLRTYRMVSWNGKLLMRSKYKKLVFKSLRKRCESVSRICARLYCGEDSQ